MAGVPSGFSRKTDLTTPIQGVRRQVSNGKTKSYFVTETTGLKCPACDGTSVPEIRSIPDHEYGMDYLARYASCGDCQTVYQVPRPSVEELSVFYEGNYHSMSDGGLLMRVRHHVRAHRLKTLLPQCAGVVLDYGCGNGSFIRYAAMQMPEVQFFGFETGTRREITREHDGAVTIVKGDIADLLDVLPTYNLLIMNHVIEHLPDPFATVSLLYGRLAWDGVFDGQTPNTTSLEHKVFGRLWSGYHAPRHTVVFSQAGLDRFLKRVGFVDTRTTGAFNPAGIAVSLASLPHGPSSPGVIPRQGLLWHLSLGLAALLMPIDFLSRNPGIINFLGWKKKS